ncbi:hypothetical protein [Levilactobacillus fuyuanensis]|uniref:hypothetical protein n=1 Tax=Levilactobacillus fuyuanensis TaxID=2486022 RepID=UPI000F7BB0C1|nr:hypothetical protein [Levilactobacillus fuyuanensis]
MSINVIRRKIPGLDYSSYGVKRSWLPWGTRFGNIKLGTLSVSINVNKEKIPGLDFSLLGLSGTGCPCEHVSATEN